MASRWTQRADLPGWCNVACCVTSLASLELQYEDYHRYAKFCTSRLRRLYRGLKINHGRSKFVRRCRGAG